MFAHISAQPIHFFSLGSAIFCVQCELISGNSTPRCLACGSQAVLSLSRILGGSLNRQARARLIDDDELNRLVRELLQTPPSAEAHQEATRQPRYLPERHHARHPEPAGSPPAELSLPKIELEPAIVVIVERAQLLTGATGAAIALRRGDEVICRARAGRTAPDLGVRLQTDSGISARCLRTGRSVLCTNAEADPHADRLSCQRLGVRSILAAPLRQFERTLGIFEVLSAVPNQFNQQDVQTIELLAGMMVAAITRVSQRNSALAPR